jgi:hypothetical protein
VIFIEFKGSMLAKERKNKTLTYKNVGFHSTGPNMKQAIDAALRKLNTIGRRRESKSPDDESPLWHVIGQHQIEKEFTFGALMSYSPGTDPMFLVDDESATNITLEKLKAPKTKDGKDRELLDSLLFFGVFDNHMVLMQSALRSNAMESHLQWLLHKAKAIEGDNTFHLLDLPPKEVRKKLADTSVRGLTFGGDMLPPAKVTAKAISKEPESRDRSVVATSIAATDDDGVLTFIKSLLGPAKAAKLNLEALAGSNIEYKLSIRYKAKTTDDGQKLMNSLGTAFRHTEDVDAKIDLVGGGFIKGSDLKLTGPVRINTYDGQPVASEVYEEMRSWLLEKIKSKDIKV